MFINRMLTATEREESLKAGIILHVFSVDPSSLSKANQSAGFCKSIQG
jgi:hypothetical protein